MNSDKHKAMCFNNITIKDNKDVVTIGNNNVTKIENINITINNFGEDPSNYISSKKVVDMIKRHMKVSTLIIKFLEIVYFNDKYPENHNMYIKNLNTKDIHVYTENEWQVKTKDYSEDIIDEILDYIISVYDENTHKFNSTEMRRFNDIKAERFENDKTLDKCKRNILMFLYNNREMIINLLSK